MRVSFSASAQKDMRHWATFNPGIKKKIDALIENIQQTPFTGLGKPEPLKYEEGGYWSRRITGYHRLVYKISGETLYIVKCRFHY